MNLNLRPVFSVALCLAAFAAPECASGAPVPAYYQGVRQFQLQNYAGARAQWEIAVAEGRTAALNNLGYLLYEGMGGVADPERAVALWRLASERGHPEAQWHLGQAFEQGKGIHADPGQAFAWYRCALISAELAKHTEDYLDADIVGYARSAMAALRARLSQGQLDGAQPSALDCTNFTTSVKASP